MAQTQNQYVFTTDRATPKDERSLTENAHLNVRRVFVAPYRDELLVKFTMENGEPEFFRKLSIIQN